MSAYCHPAAYAAFERELGQIDTTPGLFRAAFAIAQHDTPTANVADAEHTIAELASTITSRVRSNSDQARLAHLHDVLFDVIGFRGNADDYYNPANSYLPDVLRTHRGLPITLVLVYKCVAERVGLTVEGVNAPGHFLAAVRGANASEEPSSQRPWMYVDPFFGGELLDQNDVCRRIAETTGQALTTDVSRWLVPATHRQWLGRMLNNLQAVFAQTGRERDLYAMQELQELLAPSIP